MKNIVLNFIMVLLLVANSGGAQEKTKKEIPLPKLVKKLQSKNRNVRYLAARVLKKRGKEAVTLIIPLLKHKNAGVRFSAVQTLGMMGKEGKAATSALVTALKDDNEYVRGCAAEVLGKIRPKSKQAINGLVNLLTDQGFMVKQEAEYALSKMGPYAVPILIAFLDDKRVNHSVGTALGEMGPQVLSALIQASKSPNGAVRYFAVHALGDLRSKAVSAVPAIISLFTDNNPSVRNSAVQTLGEIGEGAVPQLISALKHPNGAMKFYAAQALAEIGPRAKKALPALIETFAINNEAISAASGIAAGKIGAKIVPSLIQCLQGQNSLVTLRAIEALAMIGEEAKSSAEPLAKLLKNPNIRIRATAAKVLGNINASQTLAKLLKQMKEEQSTMVKAEIAEALGKFATENKQAIAALVIALESPDLRLRVKAAVALGKIGKKAKQAIPALSLLLEKDKEWPVRSSAARALGTIDASPKTISLLVAALEDMQPYVRQEAITALSQTGTDSDIVRNKITSILENNQHNPKMTAINKIAVQALGKMGMNAETKKVLTKIVKTSRNNSLVAEAAKALKEEGTALLIAKWKEGTNKFDRAGAAFLLADIEHDLAAAVTALSLSIKKEKDIFARTAATMALSKINFNNQSAIKALSSSINDPYKLVRYYAAIGLINRGGKKTGLKREFSAALKCHDRSVRAEAAKALTKYGKSGIKKLNYMLKDNSWEVRVAVIQSLKKKKELARSALPALREAQKDARAEVRKNATEAIRAIEQ